MLDIGERCSLNLHNRCDVTSGLRNNDLQDSVNDEGRRNNFQLTPNHLASESITTSFRNIAPVVSCNKAFTFLVDDKYSRCHFDAEKVESQRVVHCALSKNILRVIICRT